MLVNKGQLYLINNGPYIAIAISAPLNEIDKFKNSIENFCDKEIPFQTGVFDGFYTMPKNKFEDIVKMCFYLDMAANHEFQYDELLDQNGELEEYRFLNADEMEKEAEVRAKKYISGIETLKGSLSSVLKH